MQINRGGKGRKIEDINLLIKYANNLKIQLQLLRHILKDGKWRLREIFQPGKIQKDMKDFGMLKKNFLNKNKQKTCI